MWSCLVQHVEAHGPFSRVPYQRIRVLVDRVYEYFNKVATLQVDNVVSDKDQ